MTKLSLEIISLDFCILITVRANPVVVPSGVVPVVVPQEPVVPVVEGGIIEPIVSPDAIVPLVNSPKVEQAVVPEVKPIIVPQDQKVVPVAPIVSDVVPAVVVPEVPVVAPVVVEPVVKPVEAVAVVEEVKVEKNSVQDPQVILSEPIDKATKLVIDLDEHIKKYLPAEDEVPTTTAPVIYAPGEIVGEDEPQNTVQRQNQMTALIDQVNRLAESIEVCLV